MWGSQEECRDCRAIERELDREIIKYRDLKQKHLELIRVTGEYHAAVKQLHTDVLRSDFHDQHVAAEAELLPLLKP